MKTCCECQTEMHDDVRVCPGCGSVEILPKEKMTIQEILKEALCKDCEIAANCEAAGNIFDGAFRPCLLFIKTESSLSHLARELDERKVYETLLLKWCTPNGEHKVINLNLVHDIARALATAYRKGELFKREG